MDTVGRKRGSDLEGATDKSEDWPLAQARRCRVEALRLAFVVDKALAEAPAQLWGPEVKAHCDATQASPVVGADAANSAWAADRCKNAWGQEA